MRWISALILLSALLGDSALGYAKSRALMAWNRARDIIAISLQAQIRLHDGRTQKLIAVLENESALTALAWQPEGDWLATGDADGRLCLWSAVALTRQCSLGAGVSVRALAWHPKDGLIASASEDQVRLWRVESLTLRRAWSAEGIVTALAWHGDRLAVGGAVRGTYEQGFLALYDESGAVQARYAAEMRPPLNLQSLQGDQLGVSTPFDVFRWRVSEQRYLPLYLPLREGESVRLAAWRADAAQALVVLDQRLLCFAESAPHGERGLEKPIVAFSWNAEAQRVALLSEDGALQVIAAEPCR
ncbi:MAG: hypothetical protein D6749_09605 [Chloroflexota bacterium]|nr:MAG: hypothetical protein D6749_09605 [Chloroflexota bacterium]